MWHHPPSCPVEDTATSTCVRLTDTGQLSRKAPELRGYFKLLFAVAESQLVSCPSLHGFDLCA